MGSKGTALITGASSGLGAAYSRALARQGYDLVLVARRLELLETLAGELQSRHGVRAEALASDLATEAGMDAAARRIEEIDDLSVLINNAGCAVEGSFVDTDIDRQMDSVRLHDLATMRLTRAALPGLIARGQGAVINLSSLAAFFPFPGNVVYNASKAFLVTFTQSLALELWKTGVRVQVLCPGFTHTSFHAAMGADVSQIPEGMWMSADEVVEESLRALNKGRHGRIVLIPGTLNRRLGWLFLLPRPAVFRGSALLARALEKKLGPARTG
jgi:short-subunit dehydrogenase